MPDEPAAGPALEGWGGNTNRLHWIRDGKAICGTRVKSADLEKDATEKYVKVFGCYHCRGKLAAAQRALGREVGDMASRGPGLQTLINQLVARTPQHDLHIETLEGCGWKVSCCNEDGSWVGWIEGKTLIQAVRNALLALEVPHAGDGDSAAAD